MTSVSGSLLLRYTDGFLDEQFPRAQIQIPRKSTFIFPHSKAAVVRVCTGRVTHSL